MRVNIKNQFASWRTKIKYVFKKSKIFEFLSIFSIFVFLFLNLIYSQIVPSLYFKFINGDKKSAVIFLQKIKSLAIFNKELNKSKILFGNDIENDVFRADIERDLKIKEFEQILTKNPHSRDILYGLFQLYLEKDETVKAKEYLIQAKSVDPTLK